MKLRSPGPTEIRQLAERIHQGKLSFGEVVDNLMRRELPTDDVNATEDRVSRRLAAWVTVADKRADTIRQAQAPDRARQNQTYENELPERRHKINL